MYSTYTEHYILCINAYAKKSTATKTYTYVIMQVKSDKTAPPTNPTKPFFLVSSQFLLNHPSNLVSNIRYQDPSRPPKPKLMQIYKKNLLKEATRRYYTLLKDGGFHH